MKTSTSTIKLSPTLLRKAREEQERINRAPKVTLDTINQNRKTIITAFNEMQTVYTVRALITKLEKLHDLIKHYLLDIERYSSATSQKEGALFFQHMQAMFIALIDAISQMNLRVKYTDPVWKELQDLMRKVSNLLDLDINVEVDMDTSQDEEMARRLSNMNVGGRKKTRATEVASPKPKKKAEPKPKKKAA